METKKNFVINTAFYAILAALALAFWKYLLPILMPFVIGFIIASIIQLPLNALPLKSKRATTPAAVVLCIVFYALLIWGMVFFSAKVITEITNFAAAVPDLFVKLDVFFGIADIHTTSQDSIRSPEAVQTAAVSAAVYSACHPANDRNTGKSDPSADAVCSAASCHAAAASSDDSHHEFICVWQLSLYI